MNLLQETLGYSSQSVGSTVSRNLSVISNRSTKSLIRKGNITLDYTMRQLPIHAACSNLLRSSNNEKLRMDLEKLISHLAFEYPESCAYIDHEGKFPLHEAIWQNAKPSTIAMIIMACPEIIHKRDKFGRNPLELNRLRKGEHTDQIKDMLLQGPLFWETARKEASQRIKLLHPQDQECRDIHVKDIDILTRDASCQLQQIASHLNAREKPSHVVEPVTWIKLEKRAMHLERLLTESYEKNYEANELIEDLQKVKEELQDDIKRLESINGDTKSVHVQVLLERNDELKEEIKVLWHNLQCKEGHNESRNQPPKDIVNFLEERYTRLHSLVDELTRSNHEYQTKIERLEFVVESLRKTTRVPPPSHRLGRVPERTIATISKNDDNSSDYEALLEALLSDSRYATERLLTKKILELNERLADAEDVACNEVAQTMEENRRLLRDNQMLQSQTVFLSSRNFNKSIKESTKLPKRASERSTSSKETVASKLDSETFYTDDLDVIFQQAAAMYESDDAVDTTAVVNKTEKGACVPQSEVLNIDLSVDEGKANSTYLPSRLSDSNASSDNQMLKTILANAEIIYGRPIPTALAKSFLWASISSYRSSRSVSTSTLSTERSPDILSTDPSTPKNTHHLNTEELEELLIQTSRLYGKAIPIQLVMALRQVSIASGGNDSSVYDQSTHVPNRSLSRKTDGRDFTLTMTSLLPEVDSDDDQDEMEYIIDSAGSDRRKRVNEPSILSHLVASKNASMYGVQASSLMNSHGPYNDSSRREDERHEIHGFEKSAEQRCVSNTTNDLNRATIVPLPDKSRSNVSPKAKMKKTPPRFEETAHASENFEIDSATFITQMPSTEIARMRQSLRSSHIHVGETNWTACDDTAEERKLELEISFGSYIQEVENAYKRSLPVGLVNALRKASLMVSLAEDDDATPSFERVIEEAEYLYCSPIPGDIRRVLAQVAIGDVVPPTFMDNTKKSTPAGIESCSATKEYAPGAATSPRRSTRKLPSQFLEIAALITSRDASERSVVEFESSFISYIREVEDMYNQPLPAALVTALREASLMESLGDDDGAFPIFSKVLEKAEYLYRVPIPNEIKCILIDIAVGNVEDVNVSQTLSTDDDIYLDTILHEAERLYGQKLSTDVVNAWNRMEVPESITLVDDPSFQKRFLDPIDDMYTVFAETATQYSQSSRRLSEVSLNRDYFRSSVVSSGAIFVDDDIDTMLNQAATMYNNILLKGSEQQTFDIATSCTVPSTGASFMSDVNSIESRRKDESDNLDDIMKQAAMSMS